MASLSIRTGPLGSPVCTSRQLFLAAGGVRPTDLWPAESRYRALLDRSRDVEFCWDTASDRFTIADPGRLGLADEDIPRTFSEFCGRINPKDRPIVDAAVRRHYETRQDLFFSCRMSESGGTECWLQFRGSAYWNPSGDCSTVIGMVSEISREMESARISAEVSAVTELLDIAMFTCDGDGVITSFSAGAERLYGYSPVEVIGRPLSFLSPGWSIRDLTALRSDGSEDRQYRTEVVRNSPRGPRTVRMQIVPIRSGDYEPIRFSIIVSDISQQERAQQRLIEHDRRDGLTGLMSSKFLRDELQQAMRAAQGSNTLLGVYCIDLDGFRAINHALGRTVGDQLLCGVADRLRGVARRSDLVCRSCADEFIFVSNLASPKSARLLCARIFDSFREAFPLSGIEIPVSVSIGVAVYPDHGDDADQILRASDSAMTQAKCNGKSQVHFFSPEMADERRQRMEIANGLRRALQENEMNLTFQPIVSADDHRILRVEALLRWQSNGEEIPPAKFIQVAEETGQIIAIGKWVLKEACRHAAAWQSGAMSGIGVSVNVSAVQFRRDDFVPFLIDVLRETGLDPGLLELELTESIFVHDLKETAAIISSIRELGISMALDDFGTGYCSLTYLKDLPIDALKIDRSFLQGLSVHPTSEVLIRSFISMARALRMRVVAEGVESNEQRCLLKSLGCDEFQGFLFGKSSRSLPIIEPRQEN